MVPLKADNRPRVQDGKSRWDLNVRYLEKFIADGQIIYPPAGGQDTALP
jgi:hypothetical protein